MRKRKSSGTDGLAEGQWWGNGFQSDDKSAAGPEKGGRPIPSGEMEMHHMRGRNFCDTSPTGNFYLSFHAQQKTRPARHSHPISPTGIHQLNGDYDTMQGRNIARPEHFQAFPSWCNYVECTT
jgi:hypothetical protein